MAYSVEEKDKIYEEVFNRMIEGESLRSILRDEHLPSPFTFYAWIDEDEEKAKQYARATSLRADKLVDDIIEIADKQDKDVITTPEGEVVNHNVINRNRLQVDARKWAASKMNPRKYGEKVEVDNKSTDGSMTPKIHNYSNVTTETLKKFRDEANGDKP